MIITTRSLTRTRLGLPMAVVAVTMLLVGCAGGGETDEAELPNIIFILADDMGYGDVRHYNPESKIPTPNIDRLAAEGIAFDDAHTTSGVCSPTRYSVLTGRYPWRSWLKFHVLLDCGAPLIPPDRMTVASLLKEHGYQTACIGKWHLGLNWPIREGVDIDRTGRVVDWMGRNQMQSLILNGNQLDLSQPFTGGPLELGFDEFFGYVGSWFNMHPRAFLHNTRLAAIPEGAEVPEWARGPEVVADPSLAPEDAMPEITRRAVDFVRRMAKKDVPFFLYFPLTAPHLPIAPNKQFIGKSEAGPWGDFCHEVDWSVGQVMEAVEKAGLSDNTLVIFTSDNGPVTFTHPLRQSHGHWSTAGFRGYKRDNWETGHRVPFVCRWPARIKPGSTSTETVSLADFLATTAAIVGAELPDNAGEDSYNILPAMVGEEYEGPIREATVHASSSGLLGIRQGRWKLLMHPGSGSPNFQRKETAGYYPESTGRPLEPIQLFDLEADPGETNNLWKKHPEVAERLQSLLAKYIRDGRSTPGAVQRNDGPDVWPQIDWIRQVD